jgi:hypothetical protein
VRVHRVDARQWAADVEEPGTDLESLRQPIDDLRAWRGHAGLILADRRGRDAGGGSQVGLADAEARSRLGQPCRLEPAAPPGESSNKPGPSSGIRTGPFLLARLDLRLDRRAAVEGLDARRVSISDRLRLPDGLVPAQLDLALVVEHGDSPVDRL